MKTSQMFWLILSFYLPIAKINLKHIAFANCLLEMTNLLYVRIVGYLGGMSFGEKCCIITRLRRIYKKARSGNFNCTKVFWEAPSGIVDIVDTWQLLKMPRTFQRFSSQWKICDVFSLLGDNHPSLNPFDFVKRLLQYEGGAVVSKLFMQFKLTLPTEN